jgi:anti-sigma B factor antagonist
MAAVLQLISTGSPPLSAAPPDLDPAAALLTLVAHPAAPGVVVVAVRGEVDLYTAPRLQDGLLIHLYPGAPRLIIDLTGVDFFGAVGLTVLVAVKEAAEAAGTRLLLVANTRPVLLPLTITGLDRVFDIYPDLPTALRSSGDAADPPAAGTVAGRTPGIRAVVTPGA